MKTISTYILAGVLSLLSGSAFADSYGAVKVECWGRCDLVNLGQICDSYVTNSQPVAISCDDTAVGNGWSTLCGGYVTCRPWGTILRSDPLSAYCDDGGGFDAVITCKAPSSYVQSVREKQDDGAGDSTGGTSGDSRSQRR